MFTRLSELKCESRKILYVSGQGKHIIQKVVTQCLCGVIDETLKLKLMLYAAVQKMLNWC